ncbi:T9SS type A sorting domain-containing protein, partial [Spirosoma luteolum]
LSTHERQLTFTPRYTGTDGQPITFQIVNETLPTTSFLAQSVSLKLYTDNPVIYLKASQSGAEATYAYRWQSVCSGAGRIGSHTDDSLTLTALGNPVLGDQAVVVIGGASGQVIQLTLTDLTGKRLFEQQIDMVNPGRQLVIPIGSKAGLYLLQATTNTDKATLKLIRP